MNEHSPGKINTSSEQYTLSVQLLEKFKHNDRDAEKMPEAAKGDAEMREVLKALEEGNPTELQIEIALAEIKNLNIRSKSLTQPEYANAFFRREISNESELASSREQLEEAEKKLYEALVKINPKRSRDYK
jgi:hypothetical protein